MRDDHVFLVPGIMGTELLNSIGKPVWSGDLHRVSHALVRNSKVLKGDLTPGAVIKHWHYRGIHARDQYGPILSFLNDLGYPLGSSLTPFGYDWRGDIEGSGNAFAFALRDTLASDPRKITIIAHSMGGLVARCALSRHPDLCDHVTQLIQIGTPVRGAASAYADFRERPEFKSFMGWINAVLSAAYWLNDDALPKLHEAVRGFDGAFQLLPTSDIKILMDAFDEQFSALEPRFWRPSETIFLERAAVVHAIIRQCALPQERAFAYFRVAANTPSLYRVTDKGDIEEQFHKGRGDGTVIAYSAREGAAMHRTIHKNIDHSVLTNCMEVFTFLRMDLR